MAGTEIDATLEVTILGHTFPLTGKFIDGTLISPAKPSGVQVGWGQVLPDGSLGPFDLQSAPSLNALLGDLVTEIKKVAGISDSSFDPVGEITSKVSQVPGLGSIVQSLTSADARITLLKIDTVNKTFALGFGLVFTQPLTLGDASTSFNIKISSFGLTIVHPPPTP